MSLLFSTRAPHMHLDVSQGATPHGGDSSVRLHLRSAVNWVEKGLQLSRPGRTRNRVVRHMR